MSLEPYVEGNSPSSKKNFIYHPALDGLRGLAILFVMAFHLSGFGVAPNGQIGVDVFFVLSGFLITTSLLREWEITGALSLVSFYKRRALRLVPALMVLLAACAALLLASRLHQIPGTNADKLHHLQSGLAFTLLYATNWARAFGVDTGLLGHTWSLAIEEQFYLLWPPILLLSLRAGANARRIGLGLAGVFLVIAVWKYFLWSHAGINRIYFGSDGRADALILGSVLACIFGLGFRHLSGIQARYLRFLAIASGFTLISIATSRVEYASLTFFWLYFVVEGATAVLISLLLLEPEGLLASLLSTRGLVWIGKLSYSLYLWHYPVFQAVGARSVPGWSLQIGLSLLLATFSYYVVECRFVNLRKKYRVTELAATAM